MRLFFSLLLLGACAGTTRAPDSVNRAVNKTPPGVPGGWHQVQAGDSVVGLAHQYGVPPMDIEEINGIDADAPLKKAQLVFVPGARGLPAKAKRKNTRRRTSVAVQEVDPSRSGHKKTGRRLQLKWPLAKGRLSSRFGPRNGRPHEGLDIAAAKGTAVMAAADGTVIYAGSGISGYGNLVILRHRRGIVTVYAHNQRNLVQEGTTVLQGQVIAEVGDTGRARGSHLHFEVRAGDTPRDPLRYLPKRRR